MNIIDPCSGQKSSSSRILGWWSWREWLFVGPQGLARKLWFYLGGSTWIRLLSVSCIFCP
uniref:Uncharacterized protein n=1 Tax=Phlebia radiata TaxID=5308 RepID=L8B9H5_PHLRA|nr:hypothetical protein Pra_mt0319 [Phlebia radiata]CCF07387.1 hypothetical protein Pra_mt0319 [Phlebia radiata]